MEKQKNWHSKRITQVAEELATSTRKGLSPSQIKERTFLYGANEIKEKEVKSVFLVFLSQFNDFMIWVLLVAVIVSGFVLKELIDAFAILAILMLNAFLGFIQESKAEKALQALKEIAAPTARVIRDGKEIEVLAAELVPGDIIILEAGDIIPADGRLFEAASLQVNESILTGESHPAEKHTAPLASKYLPLAERTNLVYMGTTVTRGRGKAIVVGTGAQTEMGSIAEMIQQEPERTPLQKELRKVGERIAVICLIVSGIVFLTGILRGYAWPTMFLTGIALAVAAIPEGLPAIVTTTLALGVQRMARKNSIVRKLHSVETLGATTFICTDKTGTLTLDQMKVAMIYISGKWYELTDVGVFRDLDEDKIIATPESVKPLFRIAALCNDARRSEAQLIGDPTEVALLEAAEKAGLKKSALERESPRVAEIPFDSSLKRMITFHKTDEGYIALIKGAPEKILPHCTQIMSDGLIERLDTAKNQQIANLYNEKARRGYRMMAFAYRELKNLPKELKPENIEQELTFVGLTGLSDPPRREVPGAIEACKNASIRVAMVTGDHKLTAESVARQIGLPDGEVITGEELNNMSDETLAEKIENITVYARVDPLDKIRIIRVLKEKGHIVAMTGDGVNDAPAVKLADIGVAMGITGTDITKEASDMVLVDDNFATIVTAIKEGRLIYDNLKKFILFLLSCNISEILTMFLAMILGLPMPLWPIQLLWINFISDGLPALALGVDPSAEDLMKRNPRKIEESILSIRRQKQIVWQGAVLAVGALSAFVGSLWLQKVSLAKLYLDPGLFQPQIGKAQAVIFSTMVFAQLLHTLNFRVVNRSVFSKESLANHYLLAAIASSLLLQLIIVYIPLFHPLFHTTSLNLTDWFLVIGASFLSLAVINQIRLSQKKAKDLPEA